MFRWCSNERVKWLEKENLMKLGANITCQITDVFIPALSMWLPQHELCVLWWGKTHWNLFHFFRNSNFSGSVLWRSFCLSRSTSCAESPFKWCQGTSRNRKKQGDPVLFSCWNCAMMFWLQLCSAVLTSKRSPSAAFGACGSTQLLIQIILETGS